MAGFAWGMLLGLAIGLVAKPVVKWALSKLK
jgi:hypothetical protein